MNTLSIAHTTPRATNNCPLCSGTFENCRCGARPTGSRTGLSVRAGVVDDIEREDDAKGFEPEARLHRLVRHLVADGDRRAGQSGLRARRTLGQMLPGHQRRESLTMTRPVKAAEEACPICTYWRCRCGDSVAPALADAVAGTGE
ncbi:hypothetical protein [Streptomyces zaomyceticus]|uniref:hypothetical protein n=1 Tax=Streptomyces zaomyceticus TaxID=68286 RepID=UPI0036A5017E